MPVPDTCIQTFKIAAGYVYSRQLYYCRTFKI